MVLDADIPDVHNMDALRRIRTHVHRWIDACDSEHEECHADKPQRYPDWVIDVKKHCLVPGENVDHYVALSYVWKIHQQETNDTSSHPRQKMLFERNLKEFQVPGFLRNDLDSSLPQIIRDAVQLVRALGMRYLWVDCLCIVQDAPDTSIKVGRMNEIYSGAYFTIVAAVPSTLQDAMQPSKRYPYRKEPQHTPEYLYQRLQQSEWAQRGWTFQEAILSKRVVVFVDNTMFWDCLGCIWSTSDPKEGAQQGSRIDSRPEYMYSCQRAREVDLFKPNFRTWLELVCLYNQRRLTYPQDAIVAFSGILNELSQGFPNGFIAGLPRDYLHVALLWQPRRPAIRRMPNDRDSLQQLPTWSCFGWQCSVDPYSLRSGLAGVPHADNAELAASWQAESILAWSEAEGKLPRASDGLKQTLRPLLKFSTTRAFFDVSPVLHYFEDIQQIRYKLGMMKVSILSLLDWERDECEILQLSFAGRKVGLLRQIDSTPVPADTEIELIAISSGCATRADLDKAYEEKWDRSAISSRIKYPEDKQKYALTKPEHTRLTTKGLEGEPPLLLSASERCPNWWNEEYYHTSTDSKDEVIHFYNVLWIARQGNQAYRRAAGRVSKTMWDDHCSGPVEITLV